MNIIKNNLKQQIFVIIIINQFNLRLQLFCDLSAALNHLNKNHIEWSLK